MNKEELDKIRERARTKIQGTTGTRAEEWYVERYAKLESLDQAITATEMTLQRYRNDRNALNELINAGPKDQELWYLGKDPKGITKQIKGDSNVVDAEFEDLPLE